MVTAGCTAEASTMQALARRGLAVDYNATPCGCFKRIARGAFLHAAAWRASLSLMKPTKKQVSLHTTAVLKLSVAERWERLKRLIEAASAEAEALRDERRPVQRRHGH